MKITGYCMNGRDLLNNEFLKLLSGLYPYCSPTLLLSKRAFLFIEYPEIRSLLIWKSDIT